MILEELKKLSQPEGGIANELRQISTERRGLEEERRLGLSMKIMVSEMKAEVVKMIEEILDEKTDGWFTMRKKINTELRTELVGIAEDIVNRIMDTRVEEMTTRVRSMVKDGKDGKDGSDGKDGKNGKDGKTPSAKELKSMMKNILSDNKTSVDKVIGLKERLESISNRIDRTRGGGGGSTVVTVDLSSQLDGSTKTFNVTRKINTPISLAGTQFPTILRPDIDYTYGVTSITLTDEVDAPASGQTLIFSYIEG